MTRFLRHVAQAQGQDARNYDETRMAVHARCAGESGAALDEGGEAVEDGPQAEFVGVLGL
jgi:hypothetical protein